jgi:hypothetical protein
MRLGYGYLQADQPQKIPYESRGAGPANEQSAPREQIQPAILIVIRRIHAHTCHHTILRPL